MCNILLALIFLLFHPIEMNERIPLPGQPAPQFEAEALVGQSFKKISLEDYKGKWLVLFFYPLDFTFVCPTEIVAFSEAVGEFEKLNCAVVGASIDSNFVHLAWANTPRDKGGLGKLAIPLIGDVTKEVAMAYGALFKEEGYTCRATFIIDANGIIRHASFNDPPVGRNVNEVLRLVEAYQYSDKFGEVCPANWVKGSPTIIPHPEEKSVYFSQLKQ